MTSALSIPVRVSTRSSLLCNLLEPQSRLLGGRTRRIVSLPAPRFHSSGVALETEGTLRVGLRNTHTMPAASLSGRGIPYRAHSRGGLRLSLVLPRLHAQKGLRKMLSRQ